MSRLAQTAACGCDRCHQRTGRHWRRFGGIAMSGIAIMTLLAGDPRSSSATVVPLASGAAPGEYGVTPGAEWSVSSPGPGQLSAFPQAFATDRVTDGVTERQVHVSWAENRDSTLAESIDAHAVSKDGAITFDRYDEFLPALNMARLDDGSLLSVEFVPGPVDAETGDITLNVARSTDLGETWARGTAAVEDTVGFSWIRAHRGILQLVDGTLLMPIYGLARGDTRNRSALLASVDRGNTWTVRNPAILPPTATLGTNEMAISRTSDGRLIGFLRGDGQAAVFQTYSDDDGETWTTPQVIDAPDGAPTGAVDPGVVLQPNGMLLLTYGRPDNSLLVSRDGTGRIWDDYHNVFANAPRGGPARTTGSSGNTAIVSVSANQSVMFGDACANIWGCREYGQLHRVWARMIDAVTPGTGKLDLATKVASGSVHLSGDVLDGPDAFPETRIEGAVDGSADRYAAAPIAEDGTLIVELDQVYTLDKIGLMLAYGTAQDADVQLSIDGRAWGKPVVKIRDTVDYSVRYHQIEPTQARYVKINAPSGGTLDAVTELELYAADTMTFENDAVNTVPRGFTDTRHAVVADTIIPGADSSRRLTLVDWDAEAAATATLPAPATPEQRVSFQYAGSAYGSTGVVFSIPGQTADGQTTTAWQFWVTANAAAGTFRVRAHTGSGWTDIGTVPYAPAETWMPVTIDTTATEARFSLNGATLETTARWNDAAGFTGITVSSYTVESASGSQHDFDDFRVSPLS
ncbi:F5/8 type C domain-containing protein [Jiangella alba]|uniref:F5/8 type C domain-containing protein n=2 Tax=Jiangella alba TaxID=561176 RepID=A0A1H5PX61_9ACTN|nr:F5/8 type C domain-containing protein [Jiangella alba]